MSDECNDVLNFPHCLNNIPAAMGGDGGNGEAGAESGVIPLYHFRIRSSDSSPGMKKRKLFQCNLEIFFL